MRGEKSKDPGACRKWHAAIFLFCEDAGVRPGTDNSGGGGGARQGHVATRRLNVLPRGHEAGKGKERSQIGGARVGLRADSKRFKHVPPLVVSVVVLGVITFAFATPLVKCSQLGVDSRHKAVDSRRRQRWFGIGIKAVQEFLVSDNFSQRCR